MDAGITPQILVNARKPGVIVPQEYVKDGVIVLNVHDRAVHGLQLGNDEITFSARFAGISRNLVVPVDAVVGIYGRENGEGLFFESPESTTQVTEEDGETADQDDRPSDPPRGKPDLRLV